MDLGPRRTLGVAVRVGLSFLGLLISALMFGFCIMLWKPELGDLFKSSVGIAYLVLIVATPVWFLFLPIIVLLKDAEGWRGFFTITFGLFPGPAALFMGNKLHLCGATAGGYLFVAVISLIPTGLYCSCLKLISMRRPIDL